MESLHGGGPSLFDKCFFKSLQAKQIGFVKLEADKTWRAFLREYKIRYSKSNSKKTMQNDNRNHRKITKALDIPVPCFFVLSRHFSRNTPLCRLAPCSTSSTLQFPVTPRTHGGVCKWDLKLSCHWLQGESALGQISRVECWLNHDFK